jgi:hypothetical protein
VLNDRSAFVRAVPGFSEVAGDIDVWLTNLIFTGIFLIIIFLTSELFNQTIRDNQDTIEGWLRKVAGPLFALWGGLHVLMTAATANRQNLINLTWLLMVLAITAFIESFLDPDFPTADTSWLLFLSLLVSVGFMTYLTEGAEAFYARVFHAEHTAVRVFPLAIFVAAVCVVFSRLGGFAPGVLYGFVGTAVFLSPSRMNAQDTGKMIFFPMFLLLTMSLGAWVLVDAFRNDNPTNWDIFFEGVLVGVFVGGLEGIALNMLPIAYMDGSKIIRWNFFVWLGMTGLAVFFLWHVLLNDQRAYFDALQETTPAVALILGGICLGVSVLTWGFFRFRPGAQT